MSLETTEVLNSPVSAGDSNGAAQAAPVFDFAAPFRDVRINARPTADEPLWVTYRLAKPTKEQDREHQRLSASLHTYFNDSIRSSSNLVAANQWLFAQTVRAVQGVDFGDGSDPHSFVDLTSARLEALLSFAGSHPNVAINGYYQGQCTPREELADALRFGSDELRFDLRIGPASAPVAVVVFKASKSSFTAFQTLQADKQVTDMKPGKGKSRTVSQTIVVNRVAYRNFLKAVVVEIEGATAGGQTWADVVNNERARNAFFDAIDGLWCVEVGMAIEAEYDASLSD